MKKVLDSGAMLAWLQDEKPASDNIQALFKVAEGGEIGLMINIINLGEIYYRLIRAKSDEFAKAFWKDFKKMPIQLVNVTSSLTLVAADLKGKYPIAYADAFAAATAKIQRCPLVTGDPEFNYLKTVINVEWLK
jgi:predicted nucleic acid-binding protein